MLSTNTPIISVRTGCWCGKRPPPWTRMATRSPRSSYRKSRPLCPLTVGSAARVKRELPAGTKNLGNTTRANHVFCMLCGVCLCLCLCLSLLCRAVLRVVDRSMQAHGGMGLSQDTPLFGFWMQARSIRIADGPDATHHARSAPAKRANAQLSSQNRHGTHAHTHTRTRTPTAVWPEWSSMIRAREASSRAERAG